MLQDDIRNDLTAAMREKNTQALNTLRGLLSAFTNELTATKRTPQDTLSDDEAIAVIRREVKRRKESAEQYRNGNRRDLAEAEEAEAKILERYLPQMMSREEIEKVVATKKAQLGVADKSQMGQLIGAVMQELKGRADGAEVKAVVENALD